MIKLGTLVKDKISGFTGIAVARVEYLYKPPEIGVESTEPKDNIPCVNTWIPEKRLKEFVKTKIGINTKEVV